MDAACLFLSKLLMVGVVKKGAACSLLNARPLPSNIT